MVDLEVFLKDYMDKFSHAHCDVAEDPCKIGLHFVGVRFLLGLERDDVFYRAVEEKVEQYLQTDFENVMTNNMLVSQCDCCQYCPCCKCLLAREDVSELFCSELAAEVFKNTGLIDKKLNSSEFVPAHWCSTRKLRLQGAVMLSDEHVVYGPGSLEERKAMQYPDIKDPLVRYDMSFEAFGSGGFWGADVSKPLPSLPPSQKTMSDGVPVGRTEPMDTE